MLKTNHSLEGVVVQPLSRIPDERGTILHGVRADNILNPFGEVYFKKLYPGIINGWHIHETLILNYICVNGMLKLVMFDMRKDSATSGKFQEIFLGDDNYCLVHIPSGIANALECITHPYSIFCNIASEAHNPELKYKRIDPRSDEIPYDWNKKDY